MRLPDPIANTTTEAYLAYKAGVLAEGDLKPKLYEPYIHLDAWLAYWTGLVATYPTDKNGEPEMLTDEEAYIAYLSGVTNTYPDEFKDPADIRVAAYLRYLVSARFGRPEYPVTNEELYLSMQKPPYIPSGDPSSDIVIDGTTKAPFVDVKMYGDTYQQSYEGHNILPNNLQSQTINGVTITRNDDGSISIRGTATARTEPRIWQSGDGGSLVFENGQTYFNTTNRVLYYYAGGYYTLLANASVTMPATRACDYVYFRVENGETIDTTIYPQIIEGSTSKAYEPYVGGQPSPSPDYPQPIQTVTGTQTVEIQGKNLFDKDKALDNYFYTSTGSKSTYSKAQFCNNEFAPASNEITMSFSTAHDRQSGSNIEANVRIIQYDASGNFISRLMSRTNGHTFTLDANTKSVILCVDNGPDAWFDDLQVEYGSAATAYAPYSKQTYQLDLGDIQLCGLGDDGNGNPLYKDYIYPDGEDWKVHKATSGNMTLNGSEDGWSKGNNGRFNLSDYAPSPASGSADNNPILSNRFISRFSFDDLSVFLSGTNELISFIYTSAATLTAWKAWLSSNNTTVCYALATPTDTTITDTNLIDQLNALKQGGAEEGTTYIKVSATDPNLPAKLYVEAPKYD